MPRIDAWQKGKWFAKNWGGITSSSARAGYGTDFSLSSGTDTHSSGADTALCPACLFGNKRTHQPVGPKLHLALSRWSRVDLLRSSVIEVTVLYHGLSREMEIGRHITPNNVKCGVYQNENLRLADLVSNMSVQLYVE